MRDISKFLSSLQKKVSSHPSLHLLFLAMLFQLSSHTGKLLQKIKSILPLTCSTLLQVSLSVTLK